MKTLPATIDTEEQNERMLRQVERLIDKGEDNLSPEEETLFKLMTRLIEDFEEQHYKLSAATPVTILKELMAARNLQAKDLWQVFGSKSLTSEVLNGSRDISKSKPKRSLSSFTSQQSCLSKILILGKSLLDAGKKFLAWLPGLM